ncbi:Gfo/Idh/MocA family protein [Virgibacillus profundi]|uniref:Gfo/Idh/MocA family protein n=1 Tax=Virgibacillus profundi TaxID=2024555 RepID=UPI0013FD1EEB|nr:Gfo/Idh/MocA family oxidoreductase [Virgibacillus profundi]
MVKVAVIGNSRKHLETWSNIKNVEVIAIVSGKSHEWIPEAHQKKAVSNAEELKTMDVDVVDLCVPVNERAEWIQQIAKEGVHIICETPLAETMEKASSIIKECEAKKVHLFVGNRRRYSPEYADARNQVNNGNVGKLGVTRLSSGAPHPGGEEDIITGLGMIEFDWLLWTFGDVERVMAKHVKKKRRDGWPVEYALITLRHRDQSFTQVELNWAKTTKETSFEISGDTGMLTFNSNESNPISLQLSGSEADVDLEEAVLFKSALERQLEHVAAFVEVQNKPVKRADDALKPIQLAEAARKSAETGQPVSIEGVLK